MTTICMYDIKQDSFVLPMHMDIARAFPEPRRMVSLFKSNAMSNFNNFHSPPPFDPSTLDEEHEIRFFYDDEGHLVRIRKERRMDGCFTAFIIWGFLILLAALFIFG